MSDLRKLGGRYPCCGDRCRYELQVGVERQVACPRCGRLFKALLVACGDHAVLMAGRPVGRVEFEAVVSA